MNSTKTVTALVLIAPVAGWHSARGDGNVSKFTFTDPIRIASEDGPIRSESPGYACPAWADVDGDGAAELLIGQFRGGKIRVVEHLGNLKFGTTNWLQADGKVAEVPGVW